MPTSYSREPTLAPKDPAADKQYSIWLADRLPSEPAAATLSSATVDSITPSGLTCDTPVISGSFAVVMTHGGTLGVDYAVKIVAELSNGESWPMTIIIPCRAG